MHTIAVVVPVHSSEKRLRRLLQALSQQARLPDEVIIVYNPVAAGEASHKEAADDKWDFPVRMVTNEIQSIPAALNKAIATSQSELIVRLDARSLPDTNYLQHCQDVLVSTGAQVVGGRWDIHPEEQTATAMAIALAVAHPVCTGGVRYRRQTAAASGQVDTVPYGCFRRSLWQEMGGFDETLLCNEDYEFFWRVRLGGGRIVFDPSICSVYFPRASHRALMLQYFRYGWWKTQMLRKNPTSVRARQLLPIVISAVLGLALVFSSFVPFARLLAGVGGLLYGCIIVYASFQLAVRARHMGLLAVLLFTFVTVHITWCAGVWTNLIGRNMSRSWLTKTYRSEVT